MNASMHTEENEMQTQQQMHYQAVSKNAKRDRLFSEMITADRDPLTNSELKQLIERRPAVWGKYSNFIGKLAD